MIRSNFVRNKLEAGLPVIGTWSVIPSLMHAEILALSGLDFLIIDREHGTTSFETAVGMMMACESHKVSPIVRVSDLSCGEIQRALDAGAHGVQIPNVHTPEQMQMIVQLTKYPPLGQRGFSPFTRAACYQSQNSKEQIIHGNSRPLISVHIEGIGAIRNLDRLLEYREIDIFFIGLYDLSKALGKAGQINDPEIRECLKSCVGKIKNSGKIAGTIANSVEQMGEFLDYGIAYLTYSVDCEQLSTTYTQIVAEFTNYFQVVKK